MKRTDKFLINELSVTGTHWMNLNIIPTYQFICFTLKYVNIQKEQGNILKIFWLN